MVACAVPVDMTVKVPLVNKDDGSVGDDPPEPEPAIENRPATDVLDPFDHETEPVLDGGVLDTLMLVTVVGSGVVLETDMPLIVG